MCGIWQQLVRLGTSQGFFIWSDLAGQSGQALLRRTQVGQLHSYIFLDFDSCDASGVLILSFIYGKKWYPIWSLTATPTGKTAQLADVLLLPGLMGPHGIVSLFHFSFVWTVGYIRLIRLIS